MIWIVLGLIVAMGVVGVVGAWSSGALKSRRIKDGLLWAGFVTLVVVMVTLTALNRQYEYRVCMDMTDGETWYCLFDAE